MHQIIVNDYQNYLKPKEKSELLNKFQKNSKLIMQTLNLTNDFPVMNFYLFPSEEVKIQETGEDGYAETDNDAFSVYMVYNDNIKPTGPHEQVHLLTHHLGTPNFVFFDGLAEYFEPDWRIDIAGERVRLSHDNWVRRFIKEGSYIKIENLFDDYKFWDLDQTATISYAESGAFIKYLVNKYGIKKVMEAYGRMERRPVDPMHNYKVFKDVFNISLGEAEDNWLKILK
ncbi:MAG: hypothetical protein ACM3KH_00265 [Thiobacillus sp.]